MVRLFVFLTAVQLVLLVLALISCLAADRVRAIPRPLWVLVILLLPLLGPIAYFLFGRPIPPPSEGGPIRRTPPRPSSPDDDPDFLRSIRIEQARRDRELLDQWERNLQAPDPDERGKQGEEDGPTTRPPASEA
jgi:Phospholipase_D-nuclease N-terminal